MKKLMIALVATAALALPAGAFAHHGDPGKEHGNKHGHVLFAVGTGTLTSGTITNGSPIKTGTYTASIAATGAATAGEHKSCAPASGTITLTDTAAPGGSVTESVTGKLCTPVSSDARFKSKFIGKYTVTAATGNEASLNGSTGFVALVQKTDDTVKLVEFSTRNGTLGAQHTEKHGVKAEHNGAKADDHVASRATDNAKHDDDDDGNCDHHKQS